MNETSKVSLSPIIRLANGVVSFIVGLSAFFVIKLILMIPIYTLLTSLQIRTGV